MKVIQKISILAVFLMLAIFIAVPAMAATTINVPTDQTTLAAAITAATAGDTINLEAGIHYVTAQLNINKALTIQGAGANVTKILNNSGVTSQSVFMAITSGAAGLVIKNLTIDGNVPHYLSWPSASGTNNKPFYGVNVSGPGSVTLQDVTVTAFGKSGINLNGADGVVLVNVKSVDNGGAGIYMLDSYNVTLKNIYTDNNQWGGVGVATLGNSYPPAGTGNIVFTGSNHFGESGFGKHGMYIESGLYTNLAGAVPITYTDDAPTGTTPPLACGSAQVCYQAKDFAYVSAYHAYDPNPSTGNNHREFFATASDAVAFYLATGIDVEELAGGAAFATAYTGPAGADGADGEDGITPTVAVGTVTTGAPGTPASVSNTGSANAAVLNFTIPQGPQGLQGEQGDPGTSSWADGSGIVTTGQKVGLGTTTPFASLHVVDTIATLPRGIMSSQHSGNNAGGVIVLRKSRGTEASPAALLTGDYVGGIQGHAYDGANYQQSAVMSFSVDGPISAGNVPVGLSIITGANIGTRLERIRVNSAGNVGIGTSAPSQKLEVNGGAAFGGGSANHAVCWKSDGKTLGYCSDAIAPDGSCTCN